MSAPNSDYDPVQVDALSVATVAANVDAALAAIAAANDLAELKSVRITHAGDRSPLALANREIGALPPAARAEAGQRVGQARGRINAALQLRQEELEQLRDEQVLVAERVDVTAVGDVPVLGARHPLTMVAERIADEPGSGIEACLEAPRFIGADHRVGGPEGGVRRRRADDRRLTIERYGGTELMPGRAILRHERGFHGPGARAPDENPRGALVCEAVHVVLRGADQRHVTREGHRAAEVVVCGEARPVDPDLLCPCPGGAQEKVGRAGVGGDADLVERRADERGLPGNGDRTPERVVGREGRAA